MPSKRCIKPLTIAAGSAFATALAAAPAFDPQQNPFALTELASGYQVAQAPAEGKCGGAKTDAMPAEGKCGGAKPAADQPAAPAGSADAAKPAKTAAEGKCGEGKCGAMK